MVKEASQTSPAFTAEISEELRSRSSKTFGTPAFPPELVTRSSTHASRPISRVLGHNVGFALTGERSPLFCLPSALTPCICRVTNVDFLH